MKMRVVTRLLLVATLLYPGVLSADSCGYECVWTPEQQCVLEWVCHPEYYTWQSVEPDWCLYQDGDRVEIRWQFIGGHLVITDWYVYSAGDPAGEQFPRYVENCGVTFD